MAIKPFTFHIWGKNLSLLIESFSIRYCTRWKGPVHTSLMQFIRSQAVDFWWSYTFTSFSDRGNLGPWWVVSPIVSLKYSMEVGKYVKNTRALQKVILYWNNNLGMFHYKKVEIYKLKHTPPSFGVPSPSPDLAPYSQINPSCWESSNQFIASDLVNIWWS